MNNDQNVLPEDFNGVFMFTNPTKEDFVGVWNKMEYTYPAMKTSPMIIRGATPEEVQHIRKKFAKDLGVREFYKSQQFTVLSKENSNVATVRAGVTYTDANLAPFIQKCLDPLPVENAKVTNAPAVPMEAMLHRDDEGEMVTEVISGKDNKKRKLKQGASYEG